jgi:hypothetical protein
MRISSSALSFTVNSFKWMSSWNRHGASHRRAVGLPTFWYSLKGKGKERDLPQGILWNFSLEVLAL